MAIKKVRRPVLQGDKNSESKAKLTLAINVQNQPDDLKVYDLEIFPYRILGQDLLKWDEYKEKFVPVSKAVKINAIRRNLENKEIEVELVFWAYDRWEKVLIGRGELAKRELKKLACKGLDVLQDHQANEVSNFLSKQEKSLTPTNIHKGLGWDVINGHLVYKHHNLITCQNNKLKSIYAGDYDITPKGHIHNYLNLLLREVNENPPLQLMICIAVSSLIIGMLNRTKLLSLDTLLVHIYGSSTTGKTTAAMLGVSIAGSPNLSSNGLLMTYNGTRNAMARRLAGNYGLPVVFDEASMNLMDRQNFSSFIYEMAQNVEKSRMSKELELKEAQSWGTTVISTGESSILAKANNNEGLRVRLFEFSLEKWTKDAENADKLKSDLLVNYGHVAPKIAEKMLELGPEKIAYMLEDNKLDLLNMIPNSKFQDRIATKFSLIITGAELFESTFGLSLNAEKIFEMLIEQEKASMSERELAPKFYIELKQYLIQYKRNFKFNKQGVPNHQEIWGKIEVDSNKTSCFILPNIFNKIVDELGYTDTKVLIDALKEEGLILHDKNKNQKRKVIFSRNEASQREEILGESNYASKGDYTYCISYEGNIFEDGY